MKVLPLYLPHRGCSHICVYCNQPLIVGAENERKEWLPRVHAQLTDQPQEQWEIAFYGGTFSALSENEMRGCFQEFSPWTKKKNVLGFRISTRPDCVDDAVLTFLREHQVRTIELGIESLDDEVLIHCGRGHDAAAAHDACARIRRFGFQLGLHLMCGLPRQSEGSWQKTVHDAISLQPSFVRIAPTLVLKDTPLARLYQRGAYTPLLLEKAIVQCMYAFSEFSRRRIPIARVGLALSDHHGDGADKVIAGPWHPSLRHEVESRLAGNHIFSVLQEIETDVVVIHPRDYSIVVGSHRRNLARWQTELQKTITIERNEHQPRHSFRVNDRHSYSLFFRET
ncbi:MAG: radical SAM protein [Candidatus Omnitrophota bacterium]|jgi:histone acetyltransferase (RNA polymerase elongator complex component)|nr:MAG: radical SAM protein [Candidatus Omnitrophota bacterium]